MMLDSRLLWSQDAGVQFRKAASPNTVRCWQSCLPPYLSPAHMFVRQLRFTLLTAGCSLTLCAVGTGSGPTGSCTVRRVTGFHDSATWAAERGRRLTALPGPHLRYLQQ